jgi:IS5 family transposase
VANAAKIYSIFEPHTDLIKRGKVRTRVEFGHKLFLAESAQGLITQYEVLKGNPSDDIHVVPSLERHKDAFGRAPRLHGADRGFFSEQNVESCNAAALTWCHSVVARKLRTARRTKTVCHSSRANAFAPASRGASRAVPWTRHEALPRRGDQGIERFELWVAAAVLANNLIIIATLLTKRLSRRRRANK